MISKWTYHAEIRDLTPGGHSKSSKVEVNRFLSGCKKFPSGLRRGIFSEGGEEINLHIEGSLTILKTGVKMVYL